MENLDLQEIRGQLDEIDQQLVKLIEQRMKLCGDVAEFKIGTGKPVYDGEREKQKLQSVMDMVQGDFNRQSMYELFTQLMTISRKYQYGLLARHGLGLDTGFAMVDELKREGGRIVYQGVEGAYSFGAMKEFFDDTITSFHVDTWKEAMEAITKGEADYAVLPIENSTAGIVSDIYDLLVEYPHYIVGEQELPVEHVLMALPGAKVEEIRTVISHPQALAQCRRFLDSNENWKTEERLNTAAAAKEVSESGDLTMAAVGSPYAAEHFGLQILKEGIFDARGNTTRFVIISGQKRFVKDAQKISVCMELPHQSGSLYNALAHFIYNDLNMTKIESRPIPQRKWEYRFFVDFEGNLSDPAVKNALRGLQAESAKFRIFGNY